MKTPLFSYQQDGVRFLRDSDGRAILADEVGLGKAQPVDCRVLTASGWVPIGTLVPGDRIIGSAGTPVTVTGVFPQGRRRVFRVLFRDGSSTRCCDEHLWATRDTVQKHRGSPYTPKPLSDIRKRLKKPNGAPLHYIPVVRAVQLSARPVPLDPYLVGYLIANGGTTGSCPYVSSPDQETVNRLAPLLPVGVGLHFAEGVTYRITKGHAGSAANPLTDALRDLEMMGKRSYDKVIPIDYLLNTSNVRLALLQGLMDGDGYASKDGVTQFTSTSQALARQVRELVWSLGGTATWSEKEAAYKQPNGTVVPCRRAYTLTIAMPRGLDAFRLERKRTRASKREKYEPTRAMVNVTPDGEAECVCISVDAPDRLYVTDDYIVTHNTLQALEYARKWIPKDPPGPIVVVAPAHLKTVWERQALQHVGVRATVLFGERVPDRPPPPDRNGMYVLNPEILTPDNWAPRTPPDERSWIAWLAALGPRLVVADEAHLYANPSSQRTRGLRWLARRVPRCVLLTGTPLPNKPENLWSLLNLLWPREYPSKWDFCSLYTTPRRTPWGWQFKGARNLDLLHAELQGRMLRRRKADVLADLPAVRYSVVPLDCDLDEYRRAERDVIAWLSVRDPEAGRRARRAAELARINALTQLAARLKLDSVVEWVRQFLDSTGRKLLLGAVHYEVTGRLMRALKRDGAVLVDGTLSQKQKDAAFDRFNRAPEARVAVCNIHAAGTGWSCTSASDAVLVELPWRPADVTQFAGRIHGVERGVSGVSAHVQFLLAADTIEEKMCELIQSKNFWAAAAIDGDEAEADLEIHSQLVRYLRPGVTV